MGGETLEHVAQKVGGCPIPAANQGHVRQEESAQNQDLFEETHLLEDISGHGRGLGVDDFEKSLPNSFMIL